MGSGIEVFYIVCAASGFLFALFAALSGHHGHAGGHHGHLGNGGGHQGHFSARLGRAGHHGGGDHGGQGAHGGHAGQGAHSSHSGQGTHGAHGAGQQGQAQVEQGAPQGPGSESISFISPLTLAMF